MIGTAIVVRTQRLADYSGIPSNNDTALRITSDEDLLLRDQGLPSYRDLEQ